MWLEMRRDAMLKDGSAGDAPGTLDVVIIGAGVSGLYALYRVRKLGLRAFVLERVESIS